MALLQLSCLDNYVAVHGPMDHVIMVIKQLPPFQRRCEQQIWMYNMYTEEWRKCCDISRSTIGSCGDGACAVTMGPDAVYLFGGVDVHLLPGKSCTNALWQLSKQSHKHIVWRKITSPKKKSPSPRTEHSGWAFDSKLWTFGGIGSSPRGYLHNVGNFVGFLKWNNQLLCCDPTIPEWTNPTCNGAVPSPRCGHSTAQTGEKVFLFGGQGASYNHSHDLYELNISSLIWTNIQTGHVHPPARYHSSLTALNEAGRFVLHGGIEQNFDTGLRVTFKDTWILDLETQFWRQYHQSNSHHRLCHTGFTGIHSVVIIGGHHSRQHDPTIHIRLQAKSLQKVAIQTLHKHRNEVPKNALPKKLWDLFSCF